MQTPQPFSYPFVEFATTVKKNVNSDDVVVSRLTAAEGYTSIVTSLEAINTGQNAAFIDILYCVQTEESEEEPIIDYYDYLLSERVEFSSKKELLTKPLPLPPNAFLTARSRDVTEEFTIFCLQNILRNS